MKNDTEQKPCSDTPGSIIHKRHTSSYYIFVVENQFGAPSGIEYF